MSEASIRVCLPAHLRTLAGVRGELEVQVKDLTLRGVVDALERDYPALRGTIREDSTGERRAFLRFFAAEEDLSMSTLDLALPHEVVQCKEPLLVVGAIAGG